MDTARDSGFYNVFFFLILVVRLCGSHDAPIFIAGNIAGAIFRVMRILACVFLSFPRVHSCVRARRITLAHSPASLMDMSHRSRQLLIGCSPSDSQPQGKH